MMSLDVADRLRYASRARKHTDKQFNPGTWVYVWRRASAQTRSENLQRSRWTGPGVVVFFSRIRRCG
eukprot:9483636-Pyramimonas_sp.AAC.1